LAILFYSVLTGGRKSAEMEMNRFFSFGGAIFRYFFSHHISCLYNLVLSLATGVFRANFPLLSHLLRAFSVTFFHTTHIIELIHFALIPRLFGAGRKAL
jgi:hypothetical protein